MGDDQKQSPTNLASNGFIVAALVATGAYYFVNHDAPLQGLRPPVTEAQIHEKADTQDIDARLWQDPFAAVAKSLDQSDPSKAEQLCEEKLDDRRCASPLEEASKQPSKNTLVIGVTMSGAPYAEDSEARRRIRYAVLAGLDRAGFAPTDAQHIGYFAPTKDERIKLPSVVPFEWFKRPDGTRRILVFWLDEDVLGDKALQQLSRLVCVLRTQGLDRLPELAKIRIRILGPQNSDTLLAMARDAHEQDPFCPRTPDTDKKTNSAPANMAVDGKTEAAVFTSNWPNLNGVEFYAYDAIVNDEFLLKDLLPDGPSPRESAHDYFAERGVSLYRTIATDDILAEGVVKELSQRGVRPGLVATDHVALISEWDTFYSRTFPDIMTLCFARSHFRPCSPHHAGGRPWAYSFNHPWVHKLKYLRGLDGQLSRDEATADRKAGKGAEAGDDQAAAKEAPKARTDANALDRPIGQGQFDYLRRIANHLRKIDEDLRRKDAGSIKAIGVVGSDVFDKLLVLRALRPQFPEALFFTTDFDAMLMMPSELSWTRNLIISSSFGPELAAPLQAEIPPFRSTYQTAAFIAARLAIGDPDNNWCTRVGQEQISGWLSRARIFEIERTGGILSFPSGEALKPAPSPKPCADAQAPSNVAFMPPNSGRSAYDGEKRSNAASAQGDEKQKPCGKDLASCAAIQPADIPLFPEQKGLRPFALTLAGAALIALSTLSFRHVRKRAGVEAGVIGVALAIGSLICAYWPELAQWMTGYGEGEPVAWLQGVSVWPTTLLRAVSIALCIYLIWRAWRDLNANLDDIVLKMNINAPSSTEPAGLLKKIARIFSYRLGDDKAEGRVDTHEAYDIAKAWSEYVYQDRFFPRFCRVVPCVAAMFMLGFLVLIPMFGEPYVPTRSALAQRLYVLASTGDVVFTLFLIFFVFDATLFCLLFVNQLHRGLTQWSPGTREKFEERLGLKHQLVAEWIDLDFVAKRTKCISNLIYYPFVVIALLIVSRSNVFANYSLSPAILISQLISLLIAFCCAILLRQTAEAAREMAKWKLMAGIVKAKGLEDGGRTAGQLETLLSRVDGLHEGAFSPFSQQPVVRALLLPLGGIGWTSLVNYIMLPGVSL